MGNGYIINGYIIKAFRISYCFKWTPTVKVSAVDWKHMLEGLIWSLKLIIFFTPFFSINVFIIPIGIILVGSI